MKLILREDVKNLGRAGDTVNVADGFGRNYLLPKKIAIVMTPANLKCLTQQLNSKKGREERIRREAEEQARAIGAEPVIIKVAVGEGGKLFGSVTTADIEKALSQRGVTVDKRKIDLEEPLKLAGAYTVPIKMHSGVTANLTVMVQAEDPKPETEAQV